MTDPKSNCCCGTGNACPTHGLPKPVSDTPRVDAAWMQVQDDNTFIPAVHADFARTLERELAAMTKERDDDERWMREMLTDYRVSFDDHCIGRRIALNGFIHSIRDERDTLRDRVAELEKKLGLVNDAMMFVLSECDWDEFPGEGGGGDRRIGPAIKAALEKIK